MKSINKILLGLGAMAIVATLPSCNVVNNVVSKTKTFTESITRALKGKKNADTKKVEKVEQVKKETSKSKEKKAIKETLNEKKETIKEKKMVKQEETPKKIANKNEDKDVTQDIVLPRDREKISQKKETPTYTSKELAKGILKGDWAIETVNGKPVVGEKAPFIRFSPSENMIYGNNGCNVIHGAYKYNPADSTICFSNIASTMMLCNMEGLTDYEINAALDITRYYSWEIRDNDFYLYFLNEARQPVMGLMHQNFDFLNGAWQVTAINGKDVDEPDMKLVIDVDEEKIHGNTGCNILNGSMEIDMEQANSISFSRIATTRMMCPDSNHETELLVALEDTSTAKPTSKDSVLLLDSQGKEVLRLVRDK